MISLMALMWAGLCAFMNRKPPGRPQPERFVFSDEHRGKSLWLQRREYAESVLARSRGGEYIEPSLFRVCLGVMSEPQPPLSQKHSKNARKRRKST